MHTGCLLGGRYVWLPVLFRNGRIEIGRTDEWDLGVFEALPAKTVR